MKFVVMEAQKQNYDNFGTLLVAKMKQKVKKSFTSVVAFNAPTYYNKCQKKEEKSVT
jgi:hypothetical protein